VRFDSAELTYGELDSRANQLAHLLVAQGVQRGTLVGVCAERSLEMVVAFCGSGDQKAGAARLRIPRRATTISSERSAHTPTSVPR